MRERGAIYIDDYRFCSIEKDTKMFLFLFEQFINEYFLIFTLILAAGLCDFYKKYKISHFFTSIIIFFKEFWLLFEVSQSVRQHP